MHEPQPETDEGILMKVLRSPVDWLNLNSEKKDEDDK